MNPYSDGRGSKDQKLLYTMLVELYPFKVIYEQPLYEINQRIDLYLPNLGVAIEYQGEQHYKFIEHFHKNIENYKYNIELDKKKLEYLESYGIKVVYIKYNEMVSTKEELKNLIDSIPFPLDTPYKSLPPLLKKDAIKIFDTESKEFFKNVRKKRYKEYKNYLKGIKV